MKYYKKFVEMRCFSLQDVVNLIGNKETARSICRMYLKKGYIERVKRDLYVAISFETQLPVANRFEIASHISDDAVVSHHSAFEYYGFANQVFYEVQITSTTRFRDFEYRGLRYRRMLPQINNGVEKVYNVCVTSVERTIVDYINGIDKVGGFEELLRCIDMVPAINENKLLNCLAEYNNSHLYQKVGCILSGYSKSLGLSEGFFDVCKDHIPKGKTYLLDRSYEQIFYSDWQMYAPADFKHFTNKGVYFDVEI